MADPVSGLAIGAAAAPVVGSLISGLFGKKKEVSGMTLPPALQAEMLKEVQNSLTAIRNNEADMDKLIESYNERISLIEKGINSTIPSEQVLSQLTENSANIALQLGASAEDLIANNFLGEDDIARIKELDALNKQDFKDEALEQDIRDRRNRIEQQLLRDGRSEAEIAQTLSLVDSQAAIERQQRTEILRQGAFGRGLQTLQTSAGLRAQNFGQVTNSLGAQQGILGSAQNQFANLANIGSQQIGVNQQQTQLNQQGALTTQSLFDRLGQFKFSNSNGGNSAFNLGAKDKALLGINSTIGLPVVGAKKILGKIF